MAETGGTEENAAKLPARPVAVWGQESHCHTPKGFATCSLPHICFSVLQGDSQLPKKRSEGQARKTPQTFMS